MWYFEGKPVEDVDPSYIGFVYCITNTMTGRRYIGKKFLTKAKTRQVKGKKKKYRAESDWKTYFGSNKVLQEEVQTHGEEHFHREILIFCKTKGQCSYFESKYQFTLGVLEYPVHFYNENIMCRIHRSHLKLDTLKENE